MDEQTDSKNTIVSLPAGALGAVVLLAVAAAAYAFLGNQNDDPTASTKSGSNVKRKLGLMTLVTLLENDATRKLVLTVLKAVARRS